MSNLPKRITIEEAQLLEKRVGLVHLSHFKTLQERRGVALTLPTYHVHQTYSEISWNVQKMETEIKRMIEQIRELECTKHLRAQEEILGVADRLGVNLDD